MTPIDEEKRILTAIVNSERVMIVVVVAAEGFAPRGGNDLRDLPVGHVWQS